MSCVRLAAVALTAGIAAAAGAAQAQTVSKVGYDAATTIYVDGTAAASTYTSSVAGTTPIVMTVGVGSGLWRGPRDFLNTFWAVGDRGANFQCDEASESLGAAATATAVCPAVTGIAAGTGRIYPRPNMQLEIFNIGLTGGSATANGSWSMLRRIKLTAPDGSAITGALNPLPTSGTSTMSNDVGRDGSAQPFAYSVNGIDIEGLVRLNNGWFFVADENAASLAQISPTGVVVKRYFPSGVETAFASASYKVEGALPAIYSKRRSNRGLESLAMSSDQKYLYTLMQSPLDNPDTAGATRDSRNARLLKLRIDFSPNGSTLTPVGEYVYRFETTTEFNRQTGGDGATAYASSSNGLRQRDLRLSEMIYLGSEKLLVLERIDQVATFQEIDLSSATNILGTKWDDITTSPTLERTSDLTAAGITPVAKTVRLVVSSYGASATAPTDIPRLSNMQQKIEGMALDRNGKFVIVNDNDFGITGLSTQFNVISGTAIGTR